MTNTIIPRNDSEHFAEIKSKDENTLVQECHEIYQRRIKPSAEEVIIGFWEIGCKYIQYEAEGWIVRGFGEGTVKKIADKLGIYWTQLYAAKNMAERFPTEQDLRELFFDMNEKGIRVTWSSIRKNVLPKNAGMQSDSKNHELMAEGERAAAQVENVVTQITEEIHRGNVPDDQIEEMVGVRSALRETLTDAEKAMQEFPKPQREGDPDYIRWIKTQPEWACVITGDLEADPHHVQSVGSGGSDALVIPLSREFHTEVHSDPTFWNRHKLVLCEWFYNKHQIDVRWTAHYSFNRKDIDGG
jgi:hypothetical protein